MTEHIILTDNKHLKEALIKFGIIIIGYFTKGIWIHIIVEDSELPKIDNFMKMLQERS